MEILTVILIIAGLIWAGSFLVRNNSNATGADKALQAFIERHGTPHIPLRNVFDKYGATSLRFYQLNFASGNGRFWTHGFLGCQVVAFCHDGVRIFNAPAIRKLSRATDSNIPNWRDFDASEALCVLIVFIPLGDLQMPEMRDSRADPCLYYRGEPFSVYPHCEAIDVLENGIVTKAKNDSYSWKNSEAHWWISQEIKKLENAPAQAALPSEPENDGFDL